MSETAGIGYRRIWFVILGLGFVAAFVAVVYRNFGKDPRHIPFGLLGKPAPPFTLRRLDSGEPVTLEQLKGRPLVLNFWASWCGPCRQEHPVLEWAAKNWGDQVQFYGVIYEDTEENAKEFLARHGSGFPQLVDPKSSMAVDYAVTGVPETYFIDKDGIIRGKYAAPIDPQTMAERLRQILP